MWSESSDRAKAGTRQRLDHSRPPGPPSMSVHGPFCLLRKAAQLTFLILRGGLQISERDIETFKYQLLSFFFQLCHPEHLQCRILSENMGLSPRNRCWLCHLSLCVLGQIIPSSLPCKMETPASLCHRVLGRTELDDLYRVPQSGSNPQ